MLYKAVIMYNKDKEGYVIKSTGAYSAMINMIPNKSNTNKETAYITSTSPFTIEVYEKKNNKVNIIPAKPMYANDE